MKLYHLGIWRVVIGEHDLLLLIWFIVLLGLRRNDSSNLQHDVTH